MILPFSDISKFNENAKILKWQHYSIRLKVFKESIFLAQISNTTILSFNEGIPNFANGFNEKYDTG